MANYADDKLAQLEQNSLESNQSPNGSTQRDRNLLEGIVKTAELKPATLVKTHSLESRILFWLFIFASYL